MLDFIIQWFVCPAIAIWIGYMIFPRKPYDPDYERYKERIQEEENA